MSLISAPEPVSVPIPTFRLTPRAALKWAAALTCFSAGMHYLSTGRKQADFGRMLIGAILVFLSLLFLF